MSVLVRIDTIRVTPFGSRCIPTMQPNLHPSSGRFSSFSTIIVHPSKSLRYWVFPFGSLLELVQIIALPSLPKLLVDHLEQLKPSQATHFDFSDIKFRVLSLGPLLELVLLSPSIYYLKPRQPWRQWLDTLDRLLEEVSRRQRIKILKIGRNGIQEFRQASSS